MVNSREIVEVINKRIEETRNSVVISTLKSIVEEIEKMEDREMRAMYAEYMQEDKLVDKWEELERELARSGR